MTLDTAERTIAAHPEDIKWGESWPAYSLGARHSSGAIMRSADLQVRIMNS